MSLTYFINRAKPTNWSVIGKKIWIHTNYKLMRVHSYSQRHTKHHNFMFEFFPICPMYMPNALFLGTAHCLRMFGAYRAAWMNTHLLATRLMPKWAVLTSKILCFTMLSIQKTFFHFKANPNLIDTIGKNVFCEPIKMRNRYFFSNQNIANRY